MSCRPGSGRSRNLPGCEHEPVAVPPACPDDALPRAVLHDLRTIVGEAHVRTGRDEVAGHVVDWTGRFRGSTPAVVRPGSTVEVAAIVALCARAGVALVPQGGNTGLVGGSVPLAGEVVLSLRRLASVGPVDEAAGQVTASAGASIASVQDAARRSGLDYAVDLASRDTATVGGTVATDAGGMHVIRHGTTRAQLLGVEAVLGSGQVLTDLAGLEKDATGYDLSGLLCGSEGTLGVITAARLRLVPRAVHRVTAAIGFTDPARAVAGVARLRRGLPGLEAAEMFGPAEAALVADHIGAAPIFEPAPPMVVIVEVAGPLDPTDALAAAVGELGGTVAAAVAADGPRRRDLWQHRERITEAIAARGTPHKLDVTLPHGRLADFLGEVGRVVERVAPGAETWLFGHIGDGNVHVNVTGLGRDDDVDRAVLDLVLERGGSISAEHGIGTAKRAWLARQRGHAAVDAMRAIKAALDPAGILNPGVML